METTSPETSPKNNFQHLKFHGDTAAYFKIWIVNTVLTVLTFGGYSAWAKVRTTKYFHQATEFQGSRLDYHAQPWPILVGRMIAVVVFGLYAYGGQFSPALGLFGVLLMALALPIVFVKSLRFKTKNTSFRNLRFSFRGTIREAYQLGFKYLGIFVLLSVVIYILTFVFGAVPDPEKTQEVGGFFKHPVMIASIAAVAVQAIYILFMAPKILSALFSFIYDNIYYGGSKLHIAVDGAVSKEILRPIYWGVAISAIAFALFTGFLFAVPYLAVLSRSSEAIAAVVEVFSSPVFRVGVPLLLGLVFYGAIIYTSLLFPFGSLKYVWGRLRVENYSSSIKIRKWDYMTTALVNFLAVSFSLGLAFPWARIRMRKLVTEAKALDVANMESFVAEATEKESALAESVSDIFDFDFDIGM